MKKSSILVFSILLLFSGASAQNNALTAPQTENDLSPVNLRGEASLGAPVVSAVDMFVPIETNGNENGFFRADAVCTDGELRSGFISENFVKPFDINSTAYVISGSDTDFSYAAMTQYPNNFSETIGKVKYGQNVNVLLKYADFYLCESNGIYGFIAADRLTLGWNNAKEMTEDEIKAADETVKKCLILSVGSKKAVICGSEVSSDEPVITPGGTTMVPVKNIESIPGGKLKWNNDARTATATVGKNTIVATADSDSVMINGMEKKYSEKNLIRNNRMYVPLRAITDLLGLKVYYFGKGMPILASPEDLTYETADYITETHKTLLEGKTVSLLWPVPSSAGISSGFGDGRGHKSIDITGEQSAPIVASASGTVIEIYTECTHDYPKDDSCCAWGYGNFVLVESDEPIDGQSAQIRYSHLSVASVNVGDKVNAGDLIGEMGCTGHSTGIHLDFELSLDGVKTDPGKYLQIPNGVYDSGNSPQYTQKYIDALKK